MVFIGNASGDNFGVTGRVYAFDRGVRPHALEIQQCSGGGTGAGHMVQSKRLEPTYGGRACEAFTVSILRTEFSTFYGQTSARLRCRARGQEGRGKRGVET